MQTDTAGNPIYTVSAWCGQCLAPTDTGGRCPNGCEASSPVVGADVVEDWKALAEERGREIERLRAENATLRKALDPDEPSLADALIAAEARLREVEKAARAVLLDDLFPLEDTPMPPLDEISLRQDALRAALAAAQPEEPHPFEPCLEDEDTPGHNFTCALLCTVCGLTREKHAAAQPEETRYVAGKKLIRPTFTAEPEEESR